MEYFSCTFWNVSPLFKRCLPRPTLDVLSFTMSLYDRTRSASIQFASDRRIIIFHAAALLVLEICSKSSTTLFSHSLPGKLGTTSTSFLRCKLCTNVDVKSKKKWQLFYERVWAQVPLPRKAAPPVFIFALFFSALRNGVDQGVLTCLIEKE